jgi:hypothetical protein
MFITHTYPTLQTCDLADLNHNRRVSQGPGWLTRPAVLRGEVLFPEKNTALCNTIQTGLD